MYIEQYFRKQPGTVDSSPNGSPLCAIASFVIDYSDGFTQAGITRINDSIRTFVWAILGAQNQTRTSILGTGKAFDAQKQLLSNVEDAINSAVDLPSSINRYQDTLHYARSKLDFVVGLDLYLIPSDMDLYIGTINGYNNLLSIADGNLNLGHNEKINEMVSPPTQLDEFDVPVLETEPEKEFDVPVLETEPPKEFALPAEPQKEFDVPVPETETAPQKEYTPNMLESKTDLTHDESKLALTLGGVIAGTILIYALK